MGLLLKSWCASCIETAKKEQKNKKKLVCCSENDYFSLFCLEISLRKIIFVKDIYKALILRQLKTERKSIGEPVPVKMTIFVS